jgi:hypothetical protein
MLSGSTLARVGAAAATAAGVGKLWPTAGFLGGKVGTLISMAVCAVAFVGVAVASGELRPSELRKLRRKG